MRILLVNVHSSWNAGDNLLTEETLRQLGAHFPGASFTLAMNDPESYSGPWPALPSFTAWVHRMDREHSASPWRWRSVPALVWHSLLAWAGHRLVGKPWYLWTRPDYRALIESYFAADLVVSTAGNFLFSSGAVGIPFLLALFAIHFATLVGKPVYTMPQSLGPIRRSHEVWLLKRVLSRTRLVLIRDAVSQQVWETWHVPHVRGVLVPDLALGRAPEECTAEAAALLEQYGVKEDGRRPWMGVTVVNWGAMNRSFPQQAEYEEGIASAIRDFASTGGRAVLFAQVHGPDTAQDDRIPSRRVLERVSDLGDRVVLVDGWAEPALLKAAYGRMDLFLGTRLHSNLFALTEGVPVVAIGYQYKTRGILRMLGLEEWMLDIDAVSAETLVPLVRRAWLQREQLRSQLLVTLGELRHQTRQAGSLVARDYLSLTAGTDGGGGR
ncbi:MAG TPA: polysaccharide pyruvyl transferase family protein [Anaerolineae bacterium]|nr:polysaccharide pyruvyl transferase family protein [Anaerolineae bacterium]